MVYQRRIVNGCSPQCTSIILSFFFLPLDIPSQPTFSKIMTASQNMNDYSSGCSSMEFADLDSDSSGYDPKCPCSSCDAKRGCISPSPSPKPRKPSRDIAQWPEPARRTPGRASPRIEAAWPLRPWSPEFNEIQVPRPPLDDVHTWPALTMAIFRPISKLGSGAFGSVVLAQYIPTGAFYAVKIIFTSNPSSTNAKLTRKEKEILLMVEGVPGMLQIKAAFSDRRALYIVTDVYERGTLTHEIKIFGRINVDRAFHRFAELVSAVFALNH